jgi:hypothetical protein
MGELSEGDLVFDEAGSPTEITYATDWMYGHVCYNVEFTDGSVITADAGHLWAVKRRGVSVVLTTEQIRQELSTRSKPLHTVETCGELQYPESDLPIDPYVLGVWLGDGTGCTGRVTTDDTDVITQIEAEGYSTRVIPSQVRDWRVDGLTADLRTLGVLENKHLPSIYLYASPKQRLAALQGLMDTDGTVSKRGHCCFDNTNVQLADAVEELCRSLGIKTSRYLKQTALNGQAMQPCHRIHFTTCKPVFRLGRKLSRLRGYNARNEHRYIKAVRPTESVPVRCIRVAAESHLFLAGRECIPTHNTYGCTIALVKHAWTHKDSLNWWVAPTFSQSKMAYGLVKRLLPQGTYVEYKADLKIILLQPDGSEHSVIEFKSGDNPDSLRGFGVNFMVVDEAGRIPYESFVSVLTTTTQTRGKILFISTLKAGIGSGRSTNEGRSSPRMAPRSTARTKWMSLRNGYLSGCPRGRTHMCP